MGYTYKFELADIEAKLQKRLAATDALAEALDEILTDFLLGLNYIYEDATGRSIEQHYSEEIEKWKEALRQYQDLSK